MDELRQLTLRKVASLLAWSALCFILVMGFVYAILYGINAQMEVERIKDCQFTQDKTFPDAVHYYQNNCKGNE